MADAEDVGEAGENFGCPVLAAVVNDKNVAFVILADFRQDLTDE